MKPLSLIFSLSLLMGLLLVGCIAYVPPPVDGYYAPGPSPAPTHRAGSGACFGCCREDLPNRPLGIASRFRGPRARRTPGPAGRLSAVRGICQDLTGFDTFHSIPRGWLLTTPLSILPGGIDKGVRRSGTVRAPGCGTIR